MPHVGVKLVKLMCKVSSMVLVNLAYIAHLWAGTFVKHAFILSTALGFKHGIINTKACKHSAEDPLKESHQPN